MKDKPLNQMTDDELWDSIPYLRTTRPIIDELLRRARADERVTMIKQVEEQRHGGAVTFADAINHLLKNMHLVTDKGMKERCSICGNPDCPEPNQKH